MLTTIFQWSVTSQSFPRVISDLRLPADYDWWAPSQLVVSKYCTIT